MEYEQFAIDQPLIVPAAMITKLSPGAAANGAM
jgi:hypothetical protein